MAKLCLYYRPYYAALENCARTHLYKMSFQANNRLWGGRFNDVVDTQMEKFNSSIVIDKRMFAEDLQVSRVADPYAAINYLRRRGS